LILEQIWFKPPCEPSSPWKKSKALLWLYSLVVENDRVGFSLYKVIALRLKNEEGFDLVLGQISWNYVEIQFHFLKLALCRSFGI